MKDDNILRLVRMCSTSLQKTIPALRTLNIHVSFCSLPVRKTRPHKNVVTQTTHNSTVLNGQAALNMATV